VYEETRALADDIASIGVAYSRGTAYAQAWTTSLPCIPDDSMEVGVGVHGEPGWMRVPATATAKDIVELMVEQLMPFIPEKEPSFSEKEAEAESICVLLNNLGTVPRLEMSILAKQVLESQIGHLVEVFAGPATYFTALNTNGFSLSVVRLQGRRKEWLMSSTECPGWVAPVVPARSIRKGTTSVDPQDLYERPQPSEHDYVKRFLVQICQSLIEAQDELGTLSAKTGTGKLGLGLSRFAQTVLDHLQELPLACPKLLFTDLSHMCSVEAGVLFAFAKLIFTTAAAELSPNGGWDLSAVVAALAKGAQEAQSVSEVGLNRRTFLDALIPALAVPVEEDRNHEKWMAQTAAAARHGARATAHMLHASDWAAYTPLCLRAGVPDGGAVAVATVFTALDTPVEGSFRRLPQSPEHFGDNIELAENQAHKELAQYYKLSKDIIGEGSFRRIRLSTCLQGPREGLEVAVSERKDEEMEELGVKGFRSSLVMEKRRMLNWLFRPKPHIVEVFEVVLTPKTYYYVMENLKGQSLEDQITDTESKLSYVQIYNILRQILTAVRELHKCRLIHRDIKPDNFCYERPRFEGELKLLDVCGMICHLSESYENEFGQGAVCGSLAYMSPEALQGRGRQAADIWAVGVTMYFMLAGSMPFAVNSIEEAKSAQSIPLDMTTDIWEDKPEGAKDMCRKLLDINARSRLTAEEALNHEWMGADLVHSMSWRTDSGDLGVASGPVHSLSVSQPFVRLSSKNAKNWSRKASFSDMQMLKERGQEKDCVVVKTLYLIRHGEAMHNIEEKAAKRRAEQNAKEAGLVPGTKEFAAALEEERIAVLRTEALADASLSTKGKIDALRARRELDSLHNRGFPMPTMVLTSPLQRALQTAAQIFPHHASVHVREELSERHTGLPCDARSRPSQMSSRASFQQMDFKRIPEASDFDAGPIETKEMCRQRAERFLLDLPKQQVTDQGGLARRGESAIAIVGHKGFLREMERGPLGHPDSSEFGNCEVRLYEVTWKRDGSLEKPAKPLYTTASLCTLQIKNFPSSWLHPNNISNEEASGETEKVGAGKAFLMQKIYDFLVEFGDVRTINQEEDPASPGGVIVTAVFSEQSAATAAAKKLHGLDGRSEEQRRKQPVAHEADRLWARVLYDVELETRNLHL